jgi:hypothetical protein
MAANNKIIDVGVPCFHRCDKIAANYIIKTCEYKLVQHDQDQQQWYHVIYFKEPIANPTFRWVQSIQCEYNYRNEVTEVWEQMSNVPIASLVQLSADTSTLTVDTLITNVIEYVAHLTNENILNVVLVGPAASASKSFLENIAAITCTKSFIHLNRFTLINMYNVPLKNKQVLLKKQLNSLIDIIKSILFLKRTAKKAPQSIGSTRCGEQCKLKQYSEKFLHINYTKYHWYFCQLLSQQDNGMINTYEINNIKVSNLLNLAKLASDDSNIYTLTILLQDAVAKAYQ